MKSVVTHSGLGNRKDGPYGQTGFVFVVVDGVDYYTSPIRGNVEDDRRSFKDKIEYAINIDEMEYYEPTSKYDFCEFASEYSMMTHVELKKPRTTTDCYTGNMTIPEPYNNPARVDGVNILGRNTRCPCGSGLKYKNCHLGTKRSK